MMKLDSKYFDSVRAKPAGDAPARPAGPTCQWKGCQDVGLYRAPVGRGQEGKYYLFCLDHVRQFNASYNYFEGWSTAEVEAFQKDAVIGHRPTWKTGMSGETQGCGRGAGARGFSAASAAFLDPHAFLGGRLGRDKAASVRRLKPLERKALEALGLDDTADRARIKARFKQLVKRHHPDANGGDKRSENKLREIIQAYNYLKQAGLI